MKLTGKCKEEFEKWFDDNSCLLSWNLDDFYDSHLSMQYGVLVDFFDAGGIDICCRKKDGRYISFSGTFDQTHSFHVEEHGSRILARTEAIKKANELFNENFK